MTEDLLKQLVDEIKQLNRVLQNQNKRIEQLEQAASSKQPVAAQPQVVSQSAHIEAAPVASPVAKTREKVEAIVKERKPKEDIESKVGGKYLNRIGIAVLVLSCVFFISYSFDHGWIGETGQILIGVVSSLLLVVLGEYYHTKYQLWSKAFTGGGLALLYFCAFAASNFYELISPTATFMFAVLITLLGSIFAVRYNSKIVAIFAIVGGFISPLLVDSGVPNYLAVLWYVFVLDAGILLLNHFKNWKDLNILAFVATMLYSFMFYEISLSMAIMMAVIFFGLFSLISVIYNFIKSEKITSTDAALIIINNIFLFGHLTALLYDNYHLWLGMAALLLAVVALLKGYYAFARKFKDRYLVMIYLSLTTAYVAVSLGILLEQKWIVLGWMIEGLILFWIGFRLKNKITRAFGMVLVTLGFIRMFAFESSVNYRDFTAVFNSRFLVYLVAIAVLYVIAYWYHQFKESVPEEERKLATYFAIGANILTVGLITMEINSHYTALRYSASALHYSAGSVTNGVAQGTYTRPYTASQTLRQASSLATSLAWAVYATIMLVVGIVKRFKPIRLLALILFGITIFKVVILDLSQSDTIYRIIAFFVLGVLLVFASYLYTRFKENIKDFILEDKEESEIDKPEIKASDVAHASPTPLNEELQQVDISGIEKVTFNPLNDQAFSTSEPSIIRIAKYVEQLYSTHVFAAGELDALYDFFMENYKRTLPEDKYHIATEKLARFVKNGGSFEFN